MVQELGAAGICPSPCSSHEASSKPRSRRRDGQYVKRHQRVKLIDRRPASVPEMAKRVIVTSGGWSWSVFWGSGMGSRVSGSGSGSGSGSRVSGSGSGSGVSGSRVSGSGSGSGVSRRFLVESLVKVVLASNTSVKLIFATSVKGSLVSNTLVRLIFVTSVKGRA